MADFDEHDKDRFVLMFCRKSDDKTANMSRVSYSSRVS